MTELLEIWEMFKERYMNPKRTIKNERILFWKLKQRLDLFTIDFKIDFKLPENYYSDPFFNEEE